MQKEKVETLELRGKVEARNRQSNILDLLMTNNCESLYKNRCFQALLVWSIQMFKHSAKEERHPQSS